MLNFWLSTWERRPSMETPWKKSEHGRTVRKWNASVANSCCTFAMKLTKSFYGTAYLNPEILHQTPLRVGWSDDYFATPLNCGGHFANCSLHHNFHSKRFKGDREWCQSWSQVSVWFITTRAKFCASTSRATSSIMRKLMSRELFTKAYNYYWTKIFCLFLFSTSKFLLFKQ